MKNRSQKGKISISGILVLLVLVYGVFVAIKFLSTQFTSTQIENEIREALFIRQGADFTPRVGRETIIKILEKKDVIFDENSEKAIWVEIDPDTFKVRYYVEYEIEINLLLFQNVKEVTLDKTLD